MTVFANSVYFCKQDEGRQFLELLHRLERGRHLLRGHLLGSEFVLDFLLRIQTYESHRSSSRNSQ